jgi:hypothetical protein
VGDEGGSLEQEGQWLSDTSAGAGNN